MDYSEQLQDSRWFELSNKIRKRDKHCQMCGNENELEVHHICYLKGKKAWEYSERFLITLCRNCHESEHFYKGILFRMIDDVVLAGVSYSELFNLLVRDNRNVFKYIRLDEYGLGSNDENIEPEF